MNIYQIKSKPARIALAWVGAIAMVALTVVAIPFVLIYIILMGIIGAACSAWVSVWGALPVWRREVFVPWWRAASGEGRE